MLQTTNNFIYTPGGQNEPGIPLDKDGKTIAPKTTTIDQSSTQEDEKPLGEKIKEALQDWSNKDQQDQDFDDTRV